MMKICKLLLFVICSYIISACSLQKGYILYNSKKPEIIATPMIKEYIKTHPNPSIVLKAPNSESKSTQSDPNSYIYNAIEKELLIAGFDVRDRGLFNEIISKSRDINYEDLQKLTGTELILELVQVSTSVEYVTNKFYTRDGAERVSSEVNFKKYGAVIEFKMTLIEKNQFAGSYTFNYVPCSSVDLNNCNCEVAYKDWTKVYPYLSFCRNVNDYNKEAFEYVSQNEMELFVRDGVRKMIAEIRK